MILVVPGGRYPLDLERFKSPGVDILTALAVFRDTLDVTNLGTDNLSVDATIVYTSPVAPPVNWVTINGGLFMSLSVPAGSTDFIPVEWRNDLATGTYLAELRLAHNDSTLENPLIYPLEVVIDNQPAKFAPAAETTLVVPIGDSSYLTLAVDDPTITPSVPTLTALRVPATGSFVDNRDGTGSLAYFRNVLGKSADAVGADTAIVIASAGEGTADTVRVIYTAPVACSCPGHGDPRCDGITDVLDVVTAVGVAFRGTVLLCDAGCPASRTDVNCDGRTDVLDVVLLISRAFRGSSAPFCDPCATPPPPPPECP